ncbi:arginase [Effusibacillus lacus]|uniref:Arginase n=1 Tax=Effusibacillus lacus TaxID=1348429 RepID=A0A292YGF7_9BACL|nr:arginase [Effusibacillus lacus]TCS68526.1 arginase [Effusibacillus lacus]GAX88408.1 arginase [Effusibacillus lacus]
MKKTISVLGVPLDLGQGRRGVDMGPSAIRYASMQERITRLGYEVKDLGNVNVPTPESHRVANQKLKYLPEIVAVSEEVAERVAGEINRGHMPIILGGDHSISIGSVAGIAKAIRNLGLIWFDAHGDMNTEDTTPSGNIHGMPLAVSLGIGHADLLQVAGFMPKVHAQNVVLVGARSIDPDERNLIRQSGITVFDMHEIDKRGMSAVMEDAIRIASKGVEGVHLSLDLDAFDPREAPGVGTPVLGGVTYREGHLAMEMLAAANVLTSVDVVEVNPILDVENRTARVAVDMICSLLGETVI